MKWEHSLKGRTIRETLSDILDVNVDDIIKISGWEIYNNQQISWEVISRDPNKRYHSYDSMKDCLKYGFDIISSKCVVSKQKGL